MRVQNRRKFRPVLDAMESRQLLSHVAHVHHAAHVNHAVHASHAAHVNHMTHVVAAPTPTNKLTAPVQVNSQPPKPSQLTAATLATQVPAPGPLSLIATATSTTTINLQWSSSQYATTYAAMYRPSGINASFVKLGYTTGKSMAVTGLSPATPYDFYIIAYNVSGSNRSSIAMAATMTPAPKTFSLTSTSVSTTEIDLQWSTSLYATSYQVWESESGTAWSVISVTQATSLKVTGLNPHTNYSFYVAATNSAGWNLSNIVSSTTLSPPPSHFNFAVGSDKGIVYLWWDNADYASHYQVFMRLSNTSDWHKVVDTNSTSGASYDTNDTNSALVTFSYLQEDQYYDFYVLAIGDGGTTASDMFSAYVGQRP